MMLPGCRTSKKTIEKLLPRIMELAEEKGAESVALPYLGCGIGGLKKEKVREIYENYFSTYKKGVMVDVYELVK